MTRMIEKQVVGQFSPGELFEYIFPVGTNITTLQIQGNHAVIWYDFDMNEKTMQRRDFAWFWTGWELPDNARHIGTLQDDEDIWHLYELVQ